MQINIPQNSASIVISPPLSGKKEFLYNYLQDSLKNKGPVIFLSTDSSSEDIKKDLLKNKIYYGTYKDILRFVDCYSQQAGNNVQDSEDTRRVPGPIALNEISVVLAQIEAELYKINEKHVVIFDSLSTLLMYSNPQMVGRFLQCLIAKIKNAGGSVLFTLEEGMHDPKDMVTIEHLMQAIIHVKRENDGVFVRADGVDDLRDWVKIV